LTSQPGDQPREPMIEILVEQGRAGQ
jgi:hypothetical protein